MELVLELGELLVSCDDVIVPRGSTVTLEVNFTDSEYEQKFPAFFKFTTSGLVTGDLVEVSYATALLKVTTNGKQSRALQMQQGKQAIRIHNQTNRTITVSDIQFYCQESRQHYAQWGIKSEVNGLKGGVGFINDGTKVVFAMDVDQFYMLDRNDSDDLTKSPFFIQDGIVVIDTVKIKNAHVADTLMVGNELQSSKIYSGEIGIGEDTTSKYQATNKKFYNTIIHENGKIQSNDVDLTGKITATSGKFYGDIYANNGYFNGTVQAEKVYGVMKQLAFTEIGALSDPSLLNLSTWGKDQQLVWVSDIPYRYSDRRDALLASASPTGLWYYNSSADWRSILFGLEASVIPLHNITNSEPILYGGYRVGVALNYHLRTIFPKSGTSKVEISLFRIVGEP
jgi:hypothetical protein